MNSKSDWAEVLRSFRQRNSLKQEAAASLLGVSQAYVSKVENGAVKPSAALLKRLANLSQRPEHRPTIGLYRTMVRHAPCLACLLSLRDDRAFIEQSSRTFHDFGHPFDLQPRKGLIDGAALGNEGQSALNDVVNSGAFAGRVGLIETVWTSSARHSHPVRHFRTVLVPLRSDQNEWLLHASLVPISQEDKREAMNAWGRPTRIFEHDEKPAYSWP